jgi:EAL domain-containing protein (putative c-di-GMP-specific phosphodiesterase class I)/GGDEF domain-containing protein
MTLMTKTSVENLAVAIFIIAATEASRLLGYQSSDVSLFWPSTSIALVLCLRRGWNTLLGSVGGLAIWSLLSGYGFSSSLLLAFGACLTTSLGTLVLERLSRQSADIGVTKSLGILMVTGIFIVSPIAATVGSFLMQTHELAVASRLEFWAGYWMVEAVSVVMFVPALMYNVTPVQSRRHLYACRQETLFLRRSDVLSVVAALFAACVTLLVSVGGNTTLTHLLLAVMIPLSFLISLTTSLRGSSVVMMIGAVTVLTVHAKLTGKQLSLETQAETLRTVLVVFESLLVSHFAWSFFNEREQQSVKLRRIANEHEISGLPNRRAVIKVLDEMQLVGGKATLIEIQLRDLFRWTDVAGHEAIGKIEQDIGEKLRDIVDAGATATTRTRKLGHIGAGRFFIVLAGQVSDGEIDSWLKKVFEQSQFTVANLSIRVRYTLGVIDIPDLSNAALIETLNQQKSLSEHLMNATALATQEAISAGLAMQRSAFSQEYAEERRKDIEKIEIIKKSVAEGRIRLLAQPIVSTAVSTQVQRKGLHYEILSRMLDDNGVEQSPAWFLPVITRARLSKEFDRAVFKKTLDYLASDPALLSASAKCSINVTGYSLSDPTFANFVLETLRTTGVPARIIVVEVTETDAISDFELAQNQLSTLASVGIRCAVDDFGVGLATFDYLKKLRPHWIKIDGSFVKSIGQEDADPLDMEIIIAAVKAAKAIGAKTVAEHVETTEQIDVLTLLGVDYLQGWALGKPMRIETLLESSLDRAKVNDGLSSHKVIQRTNGALAVI